MNPVTLTGFWAITYQVILVFSWTGSWIFPIWYGLTKPWFRTVMGRHLMSYSVVVAISMTLLIVRPFFSSDDLKVTPFGMLLVLLLGALGWWRAWIFYRVNHGEDR